MLPQTYRIRLPGGAANLEFNNITTSLPAECQHNIINSETTCNYNLILGDGSNVSQPPDLRNATYLHYFVVFKRDLLFSIDFDFMGIVVRSNITAIEISFLNSPRNSISLPDVALDEIEMGSKNTIPIESKILNNQDLAHTDNQIRKVAFQVNPLLNEAVLLRMTFGFTTFHNFDWVFLSEVRFCTDPQQSSQEVVFTTPSYNTIQPSADDLRRGSINLMCTIVSEGQYNFMWMWEKDNSEISNDDSYRITVGSESRTTNLTFESLNFSCTGVYKCTVTTHNRTHSVEYLVEYPGKVPTYIVLAITTL